MQMINSFSIQDLGSISSIVDTGPYGRVPIYIARLKIYSIRDMIEL